MFIVIFLRIDTMNACVHTHALPRGLVVKGTSLCWSPWLAYVPTPLLEQLLSPLTREMRCVMCEVTVFFKGWSISNNEL